MITKWQQTFFAKRLIGAGLLLAMLTPVSAEQSTQTSSWQYMGEIYLWGSSIQAETAIGTDIDISFNDLIHNLDMAFMGTFAAKKDKWTLLADIIYFDVTFEDEGSHTLPIGPGIVIGNELEVGLKSWIVQPIVGYNVYENSKTSLDITAGARYIWINVDTQLKTTGPLKSRKVKASDSGDVWDGIVGLRGKLDLSEKWFATAYADVGTGQSDYTWQAMASVGYKFKKVDAMFGYRHLKWKFDDNTPLDDLVVDGPYAGVRFSF